MKRATLIVTTALSLALVPLAAASQSTDGEKFRTVEEGTWYHPVEPDRIIYAGGFEAEILKALNNIENADGARTNPDQPDTIINYGPGNWAYEFTMIGDDAFAKARAVATTDEMLAAYKAAIAYYHTAAAPHTNAPGEAEALEKAFDAYQAAAELLTGDFERVDIEHDGESFEAFVHFPEQNGDPAPVLVMSNGSDMSKALSFAYYEQHLMPKGIALISIDVPGMGGSADYDVADGATEKLHVAAVEWAMSQAELDARNVFVQGVSFGGNAAARVFLGHPELDLAGVIYACGPVDSAFTAPAEVYAHFPEFTIAGVKTRLGLEQDASLEDFANAMRPLSLDAQGLFDGPKVDTPLLALTTNDDPVAPLDDLDKLIARASKADRIVFDEPGHCPPTFPREAIASAWIKKHLR